jgi:hypothetical protein
MKLADFHIPGPLRKTLARLMPVVCPPDVESLDIEAEVIDTVELMVRSFPGYMRLGLLAGIGAFELGALAVRLRPFSRLDRRAAERYFEAWWESPIPVLKLFAKVLKGLLAMGYYEQPAVHERIGYHPDRWHDEIRRRREAYAESARQHQELLLTPDPLVPVANLVRKPHV